MSFSVKKRMNLKNVSAEILQCQRNVKLAKGFCFCLIFSQTCMRIRVFVKIKGFPILSYEKAFLIFFLSTLDGIMFFLRTFVFFLASNNILFKNHNVSLVQGLCIFRAFHTLDTIACKQAQFHKFLWVLFIFQKSSAMYILFNWALQGGVLPHQSRVFFL